jgi:hypothetical protein
LATLVSGLQWSSCDGDNTSPLAEDRQTRRFAMGIIGLIVVIILVILLLRLLA